VTNVLIVHKYKELKLIFFTTVKKKKKHSSTLLPESSLTRQIKQAELAQQVKSQNVINNYIQFSLMS